MIVAFVVLACRTIAFFFIQGVCEDLEAILPISIWACGYVLLLVWALFSAERLAWVILPFRILVMVAKCISKYLLLSGLPLRTVYPLCSLVWTRSSRRTGERLQDSPSLQE